jgi:hypothetical protein
LPGRGSGGRPSFSDKVRKKWGGRRKRSGSRR